MAAYRIPVLVWEDHEGWHTAAVVEWDEPPAVAASADAAVEQLRDYLLWACQQGRLAAPDCVEPRLTFAAVAVRPEYQGDGRTYPCPEAVRLRVPCVQARLANGQLLCALPTLGVRFGCHDAAALPGLVAHYVQHKLEGCTPQALARHLPPRAARLAEIVLPAPRRDVRPPAEPAFAVLAQVAEPLGERRLRRQLGRAWEREPQVAEVVRRLGPERANVVLLGEPGCGKTTVLAEAVRRLERDATEDRPGPRFWLTSAPRLVAGMKYLGQWEERCEQVVAEAARGGAVVCVENLLDLVRTGGRAPGNSLAAFFLPYLQRGELRLAGEASPAELDACRRLLPGFADVFQVVRLPPFGPREAVAVLDRLAATLKQEQGVEAARGVVEAVHQLFRRFSPYHAFPGRAAAFLAELFDQAGAARRSEVTAADAVRQFVRETGLPERFLRDDLPLPRGEVVAHFREQVLGQEEAVQAAADLVTTFKAGLNDPGRPLGVLLLCGPTGVGKTELARALARFFFGHGGAGERLVRLDLSEYAGPGAAERLLGRPDGEPSELIRKVRQQPLAVVLLDEVEKADPEVFDVLLSVCDEGRLTDRFGRVTTFRSAVVLMTSNLGAARPAFGFRDGPAVRYDDEARAFFRPEFFNRIDAVVSFQPLGPETVRAITRKELAEVGRREGLTKDGLRMAWTERLLDELARAGFDARYGARPLQRTVEALVVTPLARFLLDHPGLRDAEVRADWGPGGVTFAVG